MDEFGLIECYFRPLTKGYAGCAALSDDAAVLDIPDGHEVVITSDTLNEGVHFLDSEAPDNIARKALRVNLSDLASMGARPFSYQLNIAFPDKEIDERWVAGFSNALAEDNERYGIFCSGGDTTRIKGDRCSISITALGLVPKGQAVRRGGAKNGDLIVLSGGVGDAALGLKVLQEGYDEALYKDAVSRHRLPQPRVGIEDIVCKYAHAAADISDGLLADCMHIAKSSGLGAEIDLQTLAFSKDVQHAIANNIVSYEDVLCGGDDYELILAVSADYLDVLLQELQKSDLNAFVIGSFVDSSLSLSLLNSEAYRINLESRGWKHF